MFNKLEGIKCTVDGIKCWLYYRKSLEGAKELLTQVPLFHKREEGEFGGKLKYAVYFIRKD